MARLLIAACCLVGHPTDQPPLRVCETLQACRSQVAHLRRAIAWQRSERRRLRAQLRYRWVPTVRYSIHLAARAYGTNEGEMLQVARCESNLDPFATNGRYAGLFQEGPGFWSATPFASLSRFDPLANALAAASVVRSQGWRQWSCRP